MREGEPELAGYTIEASLGSGGHASVYRARDASGKVVALKFIHREHRDSPAVLRRAEREFDILRAFVHDSIVRVHGCARDADGMPVLVMECLDGPTLSQRLRDEGGRLPHEEAIRCVAGAAEGADALHAAGLVHRDIKPENVIFRGNTPVLCDLGIAKDLSLSPNGSARTATGEPLRTSNYASPEQLRAPQDVDHRSDVWALGLLAYVLIAGEFPHVDAPGDDRVEKVRRGVPPTPITAHVKTPLPEGLDDVLCKALAPRPEDRYQTAQEFADALRETARRPLSQGSQTIDAPPAPSLGTAAATLALVPPAVRSVVFAGATLALVLAAAGFLLREAAALVASVAALLGAATALLMAMRGERGRPSGEARVAAAGARALVKFVLTAGLFTAALWWLWGVTALRPTPRGSRPAGSSVARRDAGTGDASVTRDSGGDPPWLPVVAGAEAGVGGANEDASARARANGTSDAGAADTPAGDGDDGGDAPADGRLSMRAWSRPDGGAARRAGNAAVTSRAARSQDAAVNADAEATATASVMRDCDGDAANGAETDVRSSAAHCGSCANRCGGARAVGICVAGQCGLQCEPSWADCDGQRINGCETSLRGNPAHCGGCGRRCSTSPHASPACRNGVCVPACEPGFEDADGANENGCERALGPTCEGVSCGPFETCVEGRCIDWASVPDPAVFSPAVQPGLTTGGPR